MTTMKKLKSNKVEMLQFSGLSGECNISHFITTRHGGVSEGNYASMNPGEYSGDNPDSVRMNRQLLLDAIGISPERIFVPYQVHEADIGCINADFLSLTTVRQKEEMNGKDALVTDMPGVCIAVSTADCVPVLVYAPDKNVVAAIHAGWRGTVKQIVAKTIGYMVAHYGCEPSCMLAGIAPSICKDSFEVGDEVVAAFQATGGDMNRIMERNIQTGKAHIDLWEANRIQLLQSGLRSEHIEISGICTFQHHNDFFSARRLGVKSGRILSGIMIKD
ncbi:peptidoglycan editing factor PgeF [uncultured Parabacteroides sp.]|nr:peptidoglycan editing factor PgeF [uncultured Parabacteroides sp.]